jgi:hypothetical protein
MTYTPKHRILVTLDEKDFALLPKTTQHGARRAWIRRAIKNEAERERLTQVYNKMDNERKSK